MPHSERRRLPWIVVAALVVVAVIVLGVVHAQRHPAPHASGSSSTSSPAAPSSTTTSPPSPKPTHLAVGITFGGELFGLSRKHIDGALDDAVSMHMKWIRIDFSWASLQPRSERSYDWAPMDAIVASARAHHLHVLGLLTYTPKWARAKGCTTFVCPPASDTEFARFASAVVHRYRDDVSTYQVWNEPNIDLFWRHPDAAAYGRLLTSSVAAMRKVSSSLRILFGGLAFTSTSGQDIAPTRFLAAACAARPCDVDAVGYDPFTYPSLPSKSSSGAWQLLSSAAGLPAARAKAGLNGTKVWITEFGAPTDYPGSTDKRAVSERAQAAIVVDGLRLARQNGAYVGAYFVDTWRDTKRAGTTRDHFGIEHYDGTHKPAFAALEKANSD